MKCTDFSMNLVLENVMKIENFQNFCYMQSFHDIQTVFSYCDGNEFLHISVEQIIYITKNVLVELFINIKL